jgi:transposase-like protein
MMKLNKETDLLSQEECIQFLKEIRWGNTVKCTSCNSDSVRLTCELKQRYSCKKCREQFSIFTNTIFEGTLISLPKWFKIIKLIQESKNHITAKEIQRKIGLTYKTAYYAGMRVRIGMFQPKSKLNVLLQSNKEIFIDSIDEETISEMEHVKGDTIKSTDCNLNRLDWIKDIKYINRSKQSIIVEDGFSDLIELELYMTKMIELQDNGLFQFQIESETLDAFLNYMKNDIKGGYKFISKKYFALYLIEFQWRYNHQKYKGNQLIKFLKNALS